MVVRHDEEWIQIATLDELDRIYFSPQYRELMGVLGWQAKAFVGHLLGLWYDPFEHLLDFNSGDAQFTLDQPPQDQPKLAGIGLTRKPMPACLPWVLPTSLLTNVSSG